MEVICTHNGIANWWQWWEVYHFHIVPAFRGFNLSGLNLAEAGNSSIRNKNRLPMSRAVAAWKDMLLQDRDYEAFLTNTGKVSGSGLNLKQRRAKFQKQEAEFVDSCLECIQEGDMEKELEMEMNPDEFFPNKRAKHKVPENFDSANVVQKRKASNKNKKKNEAKKQKTTKNAIINEDEIEEEDKEAKKKQNKGKKHKRRKNAITSEDDSKEEQANKKKNKAKKPRRKAAKKDDSSDKDDGSGVIELFDKEYPHVAKNDEKIKISQNPPQIVFINNQITQCNGCKVEFTVNER